MDVGEPLFQKCHRKFESSLNDEMKDGVGAPRCQSIKRIKFSHQYRTRIELLNFAKKNFTNKGHMMKALAL